MLDVRICRGYPSPGSALSSSSLLAGRGDFLGPSGCHHKYSSSKSNASSAIQVNLKIDWTPNGLCIEVNKTSKRNYGLTYLKCDRSFSTFAKYVLHFFFLCCAFLFFFLDNSFPRSSVLDVHLSFKSVLILISPISCSFLNFVLFS